MGGGGCGADEGFERMKKELVRITGSEKENYREMTKFWIEKQKERVKKR